MDNVRSLLMIAALVELIAWALVALKPAVPPPPGATVLGYGPKLRFFGLAVAFVIPLLLMALLYVAPLANGPRLWLIGGNLLLLGIVGGVLLLETQRTRIFLTDAGVIGHTPWRRRCEFTWSDIHNVTHSLLNHTLVLHGPAKQTIAASLFLVNVGELKRMLREKVPAEKYLSAVRRMQ